MTYVNAVKHLASLPNVAANSDRARVIADRLSSKCRAIPTVHICGGDGKNSTQRMLSSVLKCQGLTVGSYALNFSKEPRELICINGKPISYDEFARYVSIVSNMYSMLESSALPSADEMLSVCALLAFEENKCDIALLEKSISSSAGANVTDAPIVSVITYLSDDDRDSMDFHSTFKKSTRETVICPQHKDAYNVISEGCAEIGCRLTMPTYGNLRTERSSLFNTSFVYNGLECSIRSLAPYQALNAITVIEAVRALSRVGIPVTDESIRRGLSSASLPYKCETVSHEPTVMIAELSSDMRLQSIAEALAKAKAITQKELSVYLDISYASSAEKAASALGVSSIGVIDSTLSPSKFEKCVKALINESKNEHMTVFLCERMLAPKIHAAVNKWLGGI